MVWLPPGSVAINEFASADGFHRLAIYQRSSGTFAFVSERLVRDSDGESRWEPGFLSGIYETAKEAERAAIAEMPWLGLQIQN